MRASELPSARSSVGQDSLLARVLDELILEAQDGNEPKLDDYVARYPELADQIKDLLPSIQTLIEIGGCLTASRDDHRADAVTARPTNSLNGTIGDFRIVKEIGRGGMGIVYEAEQISLQRGVALKVLPFAAMLDDRQLQRFKNEARVAATLNHPHVVPVYFVGTDRGVNFFAMQLIDGQSLGTILHDAAQPAAVSSETPEVINETDGIASLKTESSKSSATYFRRVAEIGQSIAEALAHAHQVGIVHRDVKPGNILIDRHGKPWIADFGLARIESGGEMTLSGDLLGTLRYMSPEQLLRSGVVDHRTDIYSLGATLYEMATGVPAIGGHERAELLRRITEVEPEKPRHVRPEIPRDLETIILKAMQKEPAERYATANEMAQDLERFLHHQPIAARRQSFYGSLAKWTRRHRTLVAAVLLTLFVSLIVGTVLLNRAFRAERQQRQRAESMQRQSQNRLELARGIMDDMYLDLATTWIGDETAPTFQQREFLNEAAQFYQQLIIETDTSLDSQRSSAIAYERIGRIKQFLHQDQAAADSLETSIALYRQLLAAGAKDSTLQDEMSEVYERSADVLKSLGRYRDAEAAFDSARQCLGDVDLKETPDAVQLFRVVRLDAAHARLLILTGDLTRAEAVLARGETALTSLQEVSSSESAEIQGLIGEFALAQVKLLMRRGQLAESRQICDVALARIQQYQRRSQHGDRRFHVLETELLEASAELETLDGNLDTAIEQYKEVLARKRELQRIPQPPVDVLFVGFFKDEFSLDANFEAGPFCDDVITQLKLAQVLMAAGQPYEAEYLLGEARQVMLAVTADSADSLRYRVVEASVWALAADLLSIRGPEDAANCRDFATFIWQQTNDRFPDASDFRSGAFGDRPDYAWFDEHVSQPTSQTEQADQRANRTAFAHRARGVVWFRHGNYRRSVYDFTQAMETSDRDAIHDGLYLAMCHAKLADKAKATEWLKRANTGLTKLPEDDPRRQELIELSQEASRLLERMTQED